MRQGQGPADGCGQWPGKPINYCVIVVVMFLSNFAYVGTLCACLLVLFMTLLLHVIWLHWPVSFILFFACISFSVFSALDSRIQALQVFR